MIIGWVLTVVGLLAVLGVMGWILVGWSRERLAVSRAVASLEAEIAKVRTAPRPDHVTGFRNELAQHHEALQTTFLTLKKPSDERTVERRFYTADGHLLGADRILTRYRRPTAIWPAEGPGRHAYVCEREEADGIWRYRQAERLN